MIKRLAKRMLTLAAIIITVLWIKQSVANNPQRILSNLKDKHNIEDSRDISVQDAVFKQGSRMVFDLIYFGFIPLGKAEISVKQNTTFSNREVYHLVAEAKTSGFFSNFYDAKATIESYIDVEKLCPLRYTEEISLPDKGIETKEIVYNQESLIMTRRMMKRKILPHTHDPLSAVFALRMQEFGTDKIFNFPAISKKEIYEFRSEVLKENDGIWQIASVVQRKYRRSHHGGRFMVWLSNGSFRLPLLVKTWTKVGLVTIRLREVE